MEAPINKSVRAKRHRQKRPTAPSNGELQNGSGRSSRSRTPRSSRSQTPDIVDNNSRNNNSRDLRTTELHQLEHKLSNTSQFKLINSTARSKTYKIHISKNDQYKLEVPLDRSQAIKLKTLEYVEDRNELDRSIRNTLNNFNYKAKTNALSDDPKSCLFLVNFIIHNYDNLKVDQPAFKDYEAQKIKQP